MKTKIIVSVLTMLLPMSALARFGNEAIFGLSWGQTTEEVKKLGVILTDVRSTGDMTSYEATKMPKEISDSDIYLLTFYKNRLVKATFVGETIEGDPSGAQGKERYANLKSSLTQKYGSPSSMEKTGVRLYKDYDEFYECLRYSGCGMWSSLFTTDDRTMIIEIKGLSRGRGFIRISAESTPEFSDAVDMMKSASQKNDTDAL